MALTFTPEFLAQYEILEPIGEGGMGTVYRGVQRSLERPVAIKFLSRQLADEDYLARFTAEARLAAKVFHSNLVAVIETGTMGEVPYIVFELVEGASLREHARRAGGRLPVRAALEVCRQVAAGLAEAHQMGIVHRDIKPENILVGSKGVKVADFGVAKGSVAPGGHKTRSGVIMGTPAYMAPEQAKEQPVGPACDTYALGVVLYELITGRQPFSGTSTLELLSAIVHAPPPPLPGEVPTPVVEVLAAMLAKEPLERPAPMSALCERLGALAVQVDPELTMPPPDAGLSAGADGGTRQVRWASGQPRGTTVPVQAVTEPTVPLPAGGAGSGATGATAAGAAMPVRTLVVACAVTALVCTAGAAAWFSRPAPVGPPPPSPAAAGEASPMVSASPGGWRGLRGTRGPRARGGGMMRGARELRELKALMATPNSPDAKRRIAQLLGNLYDGELAPLVCVGGALQPREHQALCEVWQALRDAKGTLAGELFVRCFEAQVNATTSGPLDLPFQFERVMERLVCEAAHAPVDKVAGELEALSRKCQSQLSQAFDGLKLLFDGAGHVKGAYHRLDRFLTSRAADLLPPENGIAVLGAAAFAAHLPAGWKAQPELVRQAEVELARLDRYLDAWPIADLVPIAAELEPAYAAALGKTPSAMANTQELSPELVKLSAGRLTALAKIARAHLAGGEAGSTLPADPAY